MVGRTSTRRLLLLTALAALLSFAGGGAAWVLLRLITLITNAALFRELTTEARPPGGMAVGWPCSPPRSAVPS
jgi:chloride channel protein, CIC family